MKVIKFLIFLVLCVIISGCVNNQQPTVVTVKEIGQPAPQYSYPTTIPTTVIPAPTVMSVSGYSSSGASKVNIPGTDKQLFYPYSWDIKTVSGSKVVANSQGLSTNTKATDVVYIISPSQSTIVAGMGLDASQMLFGSSQLSAVLNRGYISNDDLDIDSISDSYTKQGFTNFQVDPTYYKINGYPARLISFDSPKDNAHVAAYIIVPDSNMIYMTMIMSNSYSPIDEVNQGYQILQSFKTA